MEQPRCICEICSCGRHRCCHEPTKIYFDGVPPRNKSEYLESYAGHGNICPPESFKPKAGLQEDRARMEGISTFKSDYLPHDVMTPSRAQAEYRPKSGKIDLGTVYQRDYSPHKVGPVTLVRPLQKTHTSGAKVDTIPTYRDDYRVWNGQRAESCKVEHPYEPPSEKFGNPSTFQDDYIPRQPNPPQSCKPCESKLPEGAFDSNTTQRTTYIAHELEPLFVRPRAQYKPCEQPFDNLTTHQTDFKGTPGEQAKSCKPESRNLSTDPFKGTSEFQDRYQPWLVTTPEFYKPREYVPPTDKMDLNSSNRLDYISHNIPPVAPIRPILGKKVLAPFHGKSTTREDFQPWDVCWQGNLKKEEQIQKPTGKVSNLTTFRSHYIPHQPNPPRSFKPLPALPKAVPFKDETSYRTEYIPKKAEVCPGLQPDALGYVYVNTDSHGHKFYRVASPEHSGSNCNTIPKEVAGVS